MIIGIGNDLVDIRRIENLCDQWGEKFEKRIFTDSEREAALRKKTPRLRISYLAKRFAAKEAFSKAIGTGIGKIGWKDIEIVNDEKGKPFLRLYRYALEVTQNKNIHLSLSDEYPIAMAFVVISHA